MKLVILASLAVLAFSDDSPLDTKIGELSKEIASIKSLIGNLAEQEEKHYKQLEKALKNQVEVKDIPPAAPSTSASTPTSIPEQSPSIDTSVYTGVQGVIALPGLRNGNAKWDSDNGNPPGHVEDAFSTDPRYGVYGCAGYSSSTLSYSKPFPVMIYYEFPSTHVSTKFTFRHAGNIRAAKTWEFVGSNDKDCRHISLWTPLCGDMVGDQKIVVGEEVGCSVPKYRQEPFKCLGIRVYSTNYDDSAVCIKAMRFWEI